MRHTALLAAAALSLLLAGCVTDGLSPRSSDKDGVDGRPQRMCEDTSVGGQSKTVCY